MTASAKTTRGRPAASVARASRSGAKTTARARAQGAGSCGVSEEGAGVGPEREGGGEGDATTRDGAVPDAAVDGGVVDADLPDGMSGEAATQAVNCLFQVNNGAKKAR